MMSGRHDRKLTLVNQDMVKSFESLPWTIGLHPTYESLDQDRCRRTVIHIHKYKGVYQMENHIT